VQVAADELRKEGIQGEKIAVPSEVGLAVETALFQAHGVCDAGTHGHTRARSVEAALLLSCVS